MAEQNYNNHIRWYIPHHFVFYPIALCLMAFSVYEAAVQEEQRLLWIFFVILISMVTWLSFMLRQHYGMTLQNRLVLLELRYRYFVTANERFEPLEAQLSFGQRAALRFAPDEELVALAKRAVSEKMSADDIKQSIKNWKGDYKRI
jgi:hypothetical protein